MAVGTIIIAVSWYGDAVIVRCTPVVIVQNITCWPLKVLIINFSTRVALISQAVLIW